MLKTAKNSQIKSPLNRGVQPGWKRNLYSVRKYEPAYGRSIDASIPIIYEQPANGFDSGTQRSVRQVDSIVSFAKSKDQSGEKVEFNNRMRYLQKLYNNKLNRNADLSNDDYKVRNSKDRKLSPKLV